MNGPEARDLTLPITPEGFEWYDTPNLPSGWQVLLQLGGHMPILHSSLSPAVQQVLRGVPLLTEGQADQLFAAARTAGPPLAALEAAYQMIDHNTGTNWLDCYDESRIDVTWTIHDVAFVHEDYQAAHAIMLQVEALIDWLGTGVVPVARLVELWQAAAVLPVSPPGLTLAEVFAAEEAG